MSKTAFVTHNGLYRYTRIPFGLKNAPVYFQRAMDIVLAPVKWQHALAYIDDFVKFFKTLEERWNHVKAVLQLINKTLMTLKLNRFFFFSDEVNCFWHVITPRRLHFATESINAVDGLNYLTITSELWSFWELCNVYRRVVPNFSRTAAPLNRRLKKGEQTTFELNNEERQTVDDLNEKLTTSPVLTLPRPAGQFIIETDACDNGCVLLQEQEEGEIRPLGYWSRTQNDDERNYNTTQKEYLAVIWSVSMLRPYVEGSRFIVRTDHQSLKRIHAFKESTGRLARRHLRFM